ncbi:hypothetical protein [Paenibacillus sp. MZ03-122A]|uniref:hypothetical protein n=1 Tax=Paenibacillus sp. MZ03-122A TaxID=2962033 RepID=UPI0020B70D32|nr:hypothetical protein [Paenibacillus sp. MZ03-122A]MCP3779373.1 hypothetical protein [Paenibacillus sp. MZ03-122A]
MTKADDFKAQNDGEIIIQVSHGEVWAIDNSGSPVVIGKIERIDLSIEEPEETPGVYRVEYVMIYDDNDEKLHDDQDVVDNTEYHAYHELVEALATKYGVSKDIIDVV